MPFGQEPDCGPGQVHYGEPGVQFVHAATVHDGRVPGWFYMACCTLWTKACNSPTFRFETAQ